MNIDLEKIIEILKLFPRKIVGGIVLVWIIGYFALQGVDWKVLTCMSVLSLAIIASHWSLEAQWPIKPKKPKPYPGFKDIIGLYEDPVEEEKEEK